MQFRVSAIKILILALFFISCNSNMQDSESRDISIFNQNKDSVVFISTNKQIINYATLSKYSVPKGSGSGFIWDKEGHIVTNYHVIKNASSAMVKLHNGKSYKASLVGTYPRRDIALLKIDTPKSELKPINIGDSKNLQVGQSVYIIGNPFGLDWTMTKGIISALNRKIPSSDGILLSRAIQTDAAINPGNSGGVMLNSKGEVIGVNNLIYSPSGGSVGIGFAIPIDLVDRVVTKLIKYKKYIKPSIGIETDERINDYIKRNLGISGVVVLGLIKGSDAENKNLRPAKIYMNGNIDFGDIIVSINGKKVESIEDLDDVLEEQKVGSSVDLGILRDNKIIHLPIKLIGLDSNG